MKLFFVFALFAVLVSCKPREKNLSSKTVSLDSMPCPEEGGEGYCHWDTHFRANETDPNRFFFYEVPWSPEQFVINNQPYITSPSVVYIQQDFEQFYPQTCIDREPYLVHVILPEEDLNGGLKGWSFYSCAYPEGHALTRANREITLAEYEMLHLNNAGSPGQFTNDGTQNNYANLLQKLREQNGVDVYLQYRKLNPNGGDVSLDPTGDYDVQYRRLRPWNYYIKQINADKYKVAFIKNPETNLPTDEGHFLDQLCVVRTEEQHGNSSQYVCSLVFTNANFDSLQDELMSRGTDLLSRQVPADTRTELDIRAQWENRIPLSNAQAEPTNTNSDTSGRTIFLPIHENGPDFAAPQEDGSISEPNVRSRSYPGESTRAWHPRKMCHFTNSSETVFDIMLRNNPPGVGEGHYLSIIESKDRYTAISYYLLKWLKTGINLQPPYHELIQYDINHPFIQQAISYADANNISISSQGIRLVLSIPNGGPTNLQQVAQSLCIDESAWNDDSFWHHEGSYVAWAQPAEIISNLAVGPTHSAIRWLAGRAVASRIGGLVVRAPSVAVRNFIPIKRVNPGKAFRNYPSLPRALSNAHIDNFLAHRIARTYPTPAPNANRPLRSAINADTLPGELMANLHEMVMKSWDRGLGEFASARGWNNAQLAKELEKELLKIAKKIEYINFDVFERQVHSSVLGAIKVAVDNGKTPIFLMTDWKGKSNYWVGQMIQDLLLAYDESLLKNIIFYNGESKIAEESMELFLQAFGNMDEVMFIFADDGVYSGSQLTSTIFKVFKNIRETLNNAGRHANVDVHVLNATPFQTEYSVNLLKEFFDYKMVGEARDEIIGGIANLRVYSPFPQANSQRVIFERADDLSERIFRMRSAAEIMGDEIPLIREILDKEILLNIFDITLGRDEIYEKALTIFQHKIADKVSIFHMGTVGRIFKSFPEYFVRGEKAVIPPYK